jgi:hypothetical protein
MRFLHVVAVLAMAAAVASDDMTLADPTTAMADGPATKDSPSFLQGLGRRTGGRRAQGDIDHP